MSNTISLQRALVKVKTLPVEIESKINSLVYATVASRGNTAYLGKTVEEFNKEAESQLDSVNDIINHLFDTKKAIYRKNLDITINVPELGEMTLADAILFKQVKLTHLEDLYLRMTHELGNATNVYKREQKEWLVRRDEVLASTTKEGTDKEFAKAYLSKVESEEPKLIYNEEVRNKLGKLIEFFRVELNIILSEQNVLNTIDI